MGLWSPTSSFHLTSEPIQILLFFLHRTWVEARDVLPFLNGLTRSVSLTAEWHLQEAVVVVAP